MIPILRLYKSAFSGFKRNIWILSLSMFINRSGSMVLLFTSLYLTNELHFSIAQAGMVMSFYGIGSVLGSYAGGWLTDRYKFSQIMILSLVCSGLILLLMLLTTNPVTISIIVFAYAYTADIFRPANSKAIALYSDPSNRTRSVSLVRLAVNLGFTVGPAAGGFLAHYVGYHWLFVIDAATSIAAAAMLILYLPPHQELPHPETAAILDDHSTSAYRDYTYLIFVILVALFGICFFQVFASIPQYFNKVCQYNEDTIGLLLALNGLLVVIIEMPFISFLEKSRKIFPFIILGVLCIPVSFILLLIGNNLFVISIIYIFMITFAEIFAMPFMMNFSLSRPHKARQGQYSALYSIAYGLANIFAPLIGLGIAGRYGFTSMFYTIIALGIICASGFYLLSKRDIKEQKSLATISPNSPIN